MEILLALDPGSSTGYCLVNINKEEKADIYEYGFIDVTLTSNYQGDHCIDLMNKIQTLITTHKVTHIAIEDYFFSKRFCNGSTVNAAFRTAIHILTRQNNIPYTILNISSWKTFVAKRATPTKEQKTKWGVTLAKKMYMQQALWEHYSFKFPNHSISTTTKKPIVFRFDIVDVIGQAIYYCGMICGVKRDKITMSVIAPNDIIWKKPSKKVFNYENSS